MNDNQFEQQFRLPEPDSKYTPGKRSNFIGVIFTIVIAIGIALAFLNRQRLIDQYVVMTFKPSAAVTVMADRAGLNDTGKFYLYASQTEVDDRAAFNDACSKLLNEKTVVLGCYTGALKRIYVFKVNDERLDGVEDVTAAHEMLHAAYDRLSSSEKQKVDALLLAQQKSITDPRLISLIKEYQQTEPTEVVNELHSIFGTEIRTLSPELEAYYKRYFSDRGAVVTLKEKYEKVFTNLAEQQTQLVNRLNELAQDVNTRQDNYQNALASLNKEISTFNNWAQSGNATRSEYNARRAALETRISALEAERNAINAEIDEYTTKKAELDKLNLQAENLNQSIDSQKIPSAPSL